MKKNLNMAVDNDEHFAGVSRAGKKVKQFPLRNFGLTSDDSVKKKKEMMLESCFAALKASIDGIIIIDSNGSIVRTNRAFAQISGYNVEEELEGKNWIDLFLSPVKNDIIKRIVPSVKTEGRWVGEVSLLRRGNNPISMEITLSPIQDGGMVCVLRDIANQKRTEDALRWSRNYYLSLFNKFPTLIWQSGVNGVRFFFNKTWLFLTGRTMEQEMFDGWEEGIHPDDLENHRKIYRHHFATKMSYTLEYRLRNSLGEYSWIRENGQPFFGMDGAFSGFIGSCFDITEKKELTDQLIRSEKLSAVGQLAAGIAHEFNNMLAVIKLSAQLLLRETQSKEETMRTIKNIDDITTKGATIVSDMLSFARPERLPEKNGLISDVIRECLAFQEKQIFMENISVTTDLADERPILIDNNQMQQVFLNLVINARHALKEKGGGNIFISTHVKDNVLVVTFSDNGSGMTEETRQKLFTPFYTTKSAFTGDGSDVHGTGLGLVMSNTIIKNHGGDISFESREGDGTKFIMTFPIPDEDASLVNGKNKEEHSYESGDDIDRNVEILVIDNETAFIEVFCKMLKSFGFTKVTAIHEAIEVGKMLSIRKFDIIFLNHAMRSGNGKEGIKVIHSMQPSVPVILFAGRLMVEHDELSSLGAVECLEKPFLVDELFRAIRKAVVARF